MPVVPDISQGEQAQESPSSQPETQLETTPPAPVIPQPEALPVQPVPVTQQDVPLAPTQESIRQSVRAYEDVTPDSATTLDQIARNYKAPFDMVKNQSKEFLKSNDENTLISTISEKDPLGNPIYPSTLEAFSDPKFAVKNKDDPRSVTRIESAIKEWERIRNLPENFNPIEAGVSQPISNEEIAKIKQEDIAAGRTQLETYAGAGVQGFTQGLTNIGKFGATLANPLIGDGKDVNQNFVYKIFDDIEKEVETELPQNPQFKNDITASIFNGLGQVVSNVGAGGVTGLAARAPKAFAIANGIIQEFVGIYEDAKQHNAKDSQALLAATLGGGPAGVLEGIFPGQLMDKLFVEKASKPFVKELLSAALGIGEEATTEFLQSGIENATAKAIYDNDRGYWDGAKEAGLAGGGTAAVAELLVGLATGHRPVVRQDQKRQVSPEIIQSLNQHVAELRQIQQKEVEHEIQTKTLDDLKTIANESAQGSRNPEDMVEIIERASGGSESTRNFPVDAEKLSQVFFQDAKTEEEVAKSQNDLLQFAQTMGTGPAELDEAIKNGLDIKVNTAQLVAKYRDHPVFDGIKNIGDEEIQQAKLDLTEAQRDLQTALKTPSVVPDQIQVVRSQLMVPKEKGGFGLSAQDAEANISLITAMQVQQANALGLTLEEHLTKNPLRVETGETVEQFKERISQEAQTKTTSEPFFKVAKDQWTRAVDIVEKAIPETSNELSPENVEAINKEFAAAGIPLNEADIKNISNDFIEARNASKESKNQSTAWEKVIKGDVSPETIKIIAGDAKIDQDTAIRKLVKNFHISKKQAVDLLTPLVKNEKEKVSVKAMLKAANEFEKKSKIKIQGRVLNKLTEQARKEMNKLLPAPRDIIHVALENGGLAPISEFKKLWKENPNQAKLSGEIKTLYESVPALFKKGGTTSLDRLRESIGQDSDFTNLTDATETDLIGMILQAKNDRGNRRSNQKFQGELTPQENGKPSKLTEAPQISMEAMRKLVAQSELEKFKESGRKAQDQTHDMFEKPAQKTLFQSGNPIQTDTEEFKKWFGESKVQDEKGNPLVVFHGSNSPKSFSTFNQKKSLELGFHFGSIEQATNRISIGKEFDTPAEALAFQNLAKAQRRPKIFPVYLKIENPLDLVSDVGDWGNIQQIKEYLGPVNYEIFTNKEMEGWKTVEDVKQSLIGKGYDGIKYQNENEGKGTSWIAFNPEQIKSAIGNTGAFDPNNPDIRFQKQRGAFRIDPKTGARIISVFQTGDHSTIIHELFHVHMQFMTDLIASGQASPQIQEDFKKLMDFAGVQDWNALTEKEKIQVEEKLATAHEAYAMEGKAPSEELTGVFSRIRKWMIDVYQSIKKLGVPITDEIRGVFDRFYATQSEIEQAKQYYESRKDLLKLIPAEESAKTAVKAQKEELEADQITKATARRMKAYIKAQEGIQGIRKGIESQVDQDPFYRMLSKAEQVGLNTAAFVDTYGQKLADELSAKFPNLLKEDGKLVVSELAPEFDFEDDNSLIEAFRSGLPKAQEIDSRVEKHLNDAEKQISEDVAKDVTDGDGDVHTEKSLAYLIAETQLMIDGAAREGALKRSRVIEKVYRDAASEALGNKRMKESVRYDLFAKAEARFAREFAGLMVKIDKVSRRLGMTAEQKAQAEKDLQEKSNVLSDTKKEAKAVGKEVKQVEKQVEKATGRETNISNNINDLYKRALEVRKKQLLNHAMVQETIKNRETISKALNSYTNKKINSMLDRVEFEYRAPIREILSRYGLGKPNAQPYDLSLVQNLDADLYSTMPDFIKSAQKQGSYRDLTVNEFKDLHSYIQKIEAVGSNTMKSLKGERIQKIADVLTEMLSSLNQVKDKQVPQNSNNLQLAKWIKARWQNMNESVASPTFLMEAADAWASEHGRPGMHKILLSKFRQAENTNAVMNDQVYKELFPHFNKLADAITRIKKEHGGGFFEIPGFPKPAKAYLKGETKWSSEELIMALLNIGTEKNLKAMQDGYGLNAERMNAISKFFHADELKAIQGIWDEINKLYPALDANYFELYNDHLKKEEAKPVTLTDSEGKQVTLKGGYFPLAYDHRLDERKTAIDLEAEERMKGVLRQMKLSDSFTKGRLDGQKAPPRLSMSVLTNHLRDTTRYITHSLLVRDMKIVMNNREWSDTFQKKIGVEAFNSMKDWLEFQQNPDRDTATFFRSSEANKQFESFVDWNRRMAQYLMLGYKVGSAAVQKLGLVTAGQRIGWNYMFKAAKTVGFGGVATQLTGFPSEAFENAKRESVDIRNREKAVDRNQVEAMGAIKPFPRFRVKIGDQTFTWKDVQDFGLSLLKYSDRGVVLMTYEAAKDKYITEFYDSSKSQSQNYKDAISYAGGIIEETQPTGLASDTNFWQRNPNKLFRMFTMVTSWSMKYSSMVSSKTRAMQEGKISKGEYINFLAQNLILVSVMEELLRSLLRWETPDWMDMFFNMLSSRIGWIPIVKDIPYALKSKRPIEEFVSRNSAFEPTARIANALQATLSDKKTWGDALGSYGKAAEAVAGVPVSNAIRDMTKLSENVEKDLQD